MGTIIVKWSPPTTLNDGTTAVPAGDLAYVDVEIGVVQADGSPTVFASVAHELDPSTSHTFQDYAAGDYDIRLTEVDVHAQRGTPTTTRVTVPAPVVIPLPPGPVQGVTASATA